MNVRRVIKKKFLFIVLLGGFFLLSVNKFFTGNFNNFSKLESKARNVFSAISPSVANADVPIFAPTDYGNRGCDKGPGSTDGIDGAPGS